MRASERASVAGDQQISEPSVTDQWRGLIIVGVAVLGAVVLGMIGFAAHPLYAKGYGTLDYLYLSIQLFILQSGAVPPPLPLTLEIARFLAPMLAAWATVQAFTAIFRVETDGLLARLNRNHVIVCGGGTIGRFLAAELRAAGRGVTIIEKRWDLALFSQLRRNGARVVAGDATDPHVLLRAGLRRASDIITLCGDDAINAQVAVAVRSLTLTGSRRGQLRCFVAVDDADVCRLLQTDALNRSQGDAPIEFFSLAERAAKAMLDMYPPLHPAGAWVVIGEGPDARELCEQANVRAHAAGGAWITLPLDAVMPAPGEARAPGPGRVEGNAVAVAYVSATSDAAAFRAALRILNQVSPDTPVVLRQQSHSAWPALLDAPGRAPLRVFSQLEHSCRPEHLLLQINETVAHATHEMYVEDQRRRGETPATNPSMVPWQQLPETLRCANRAQASHIGLTLRAIGCMVVPAPAIAASLSEGEIELLASAEHARWYRERTSDGWTFADGPKNAGAKTHPHLLPWEALSEDARDLDRAAIAALPAILERHGFLIYRRVAQASPAAPSIV